MRIDHKEAVVVGVFLSMVYHYLQINLWGQLMAIAFPAWYADFAQENVALALALWDGFQHLVALVVLIIPTAMVLRFVMGKRAVATALVLAVVSFLLLLFYPAWSLSWNYFRSSFGSHLFFNWSAILYSIGHNLGPLLLVCLLERWDRRKPLQNGRSFNTA